MAPINLPDGTEVSEVILPDGASASEVIAPDGSAVFGNAIPDSGDLQAHYDATELGLSNNDPVSEWPDISGNGYDLLQGTASDQPTFVTDGINGNPAISLDGDNDHVKTSGNPSLTTQPSTVLVVFDIVDSNRRNRLFDGEDANKNLVSYRNPDWHYWAGTFVGDGSDDATIQQITAVFDGASSLFREEGTETQTGDPADNDMDSGLSIGIDGDNGGSLGEFKMGELIFHDARLTPSEITEWENYLQSKWGW